MGRRDKHNADIAYLHKLGIIRPEQSDHVLAEQEKEQYHHAFDNDTFQDTKL